MPISTQTPDPAESRTRETSLDLYKGVAIVAVVVHHVTGGIAVRNTQEGSTSHLIAVLLNRFALFCVPAFVFLAVYLLSLSQLRRPITLSEFWRRRAPRVLWPYITWSLFYGCYGAVVDPRRVAMISDPMTWGTWLLHGKASYHLYFLLILLQIYLVLPDLVAAVGGIASGRFPSSRRLTAVALISTVAAFYGRRVFHAPLLTPILQATTTAAIYFVTREICAWFATRRPPLAFWLTLAALVQVAIYFIHRRFIYSASPATLAIWYAGVVIAGVAAAVCADEFRRERKRYALGLGTVALAAWTLFIPAAMRSVDGGPVDALTYSLLYWTFTGSMVLLLLAACRWAVGWPLARPLATLGTRSMEIYLIHPALLVWFTRIHPHGGSLKVLVYSILALVTIVAASCVLAWLLRRLGLGQLLFGR